MNKKFIGAVCLVAGTAIGAGMLALPMTFAKLGLLPTLIVLGITWAVMYYATLINLELNLQAGKGLSLGDLGKYYGGRFSQAVGFVSMLFLGYALLCAYLYGGTSIVQSLLQKFTGEPVSFELILSLCFLVLIGILRCAFSHVEKINQLLFLGLVVVIGVVIVMLIGHVQIQSLPLLTDFWKEKSSWAIVLPTVFTSFGLNAVVQPLTSYCDKDPILLKRAFFWGSILPLVLYVIWTVSILGILHSHNPALYQEILKGTIEVGKLIEALSEITSWKSLQLVVWALSLLAIITSAIGISLGVISMWETGLSKNKDHTFSHEKKTPMSLVGLTLLLPFGIAFFIPQAFIKALGFAGMILVIITLILPLYLLYKAKFQKDFFYPILRNKLLWLLSFFFGIGIIVCEIINIGQ